ncbi:MAG: WD40 repeat domain-containing protein [Methylococcaceae bacterium]|nr:WD40 repeat domain-containing protein [Methylococcaceae bacterium]
MNKSFLVPLLLSFLLVACDNTPKAERTYELAQQGLFSASLSKNFALIGTTARGNAELWQLKPKQLLHTWQHTDEKNGILYTAISDNEQYALTAEKESLAWWRISDGVLMNVWYLPNISAITLSADGQFALIGLEDKAIYYSLQHGTTRYAFKHESSVTKVDISASNQLAITGSSDETAKLWDLNNGQEKFSWPHQSKLSVVAISPDDKYALTNEGLGTVRLWKTQTGKLYKQLGSQLITLSAATFSDNSKYLMGGRVSQRIDLWDIKRGEIINYWRPKKDSFWTPSAATILALTFSENERKIYSIASNGYLQLWKK